MAGLNNRLGGWIDENNGLVCRMDFFFLFELDNIVRYVFGSEDGF